MHDMVAAPGEFPAQLELERVTREIVDDYSHECNPPV
jgi:hypothetical protein